MTVELKVPEVGESITEAEITKWLKHDGERVESDEPVVVLETDKATLEVPAPVSGTIRELVKEEGETVEIGEVIAYMEEGEPASSGGGRGEKAEAPAKDDECTEENERGREAGSNELLQREASEDEQARSRTSEKERPARDREAGPDGGERPRVRVSPSVRRLLVDHDLSADDVEPTGPGHRLLKEDVVRYLRDNDVPEEESQDITEKDVVEASERDEEIVRMSPMRRRIAERLTEATCQAALLTTFNECDMSRVIELRRSLQDAFQARYDVKLGFMSFFVKAVVQVLQDIPEINAEVRGTDIAYRHYCDIGVAVGGGEGLVVPVLRNAERLSFAEIEAAIDDFADRARTKDIKLEELQGGTFTITNGGVYGSLLSTPIVNPPQSGILGLHAIEERPVARGGEVVIRPMMYVALTYDHRIVDGREAVKFLRRIKTMIEEPSRILIEV